MVKMFININGNLVNQLPVSDSSITVNGKDYTVTNVVHDYEYVDALIVRIAIWVYCTADTEVPYKEQG